MRNPKITKSVKTVVTLNGIDYDLGTLYTTIQGYCTVTKKNKYYFKCLNTGKTFSYQKKLTNHIVKFLIDSGKVVLT
jgi:hypothetical protein